MQKVGFLQYLQQNLSNRLVDDLSLNHADVLHDAGKGFQDSQIKQVESIVIEEMQNAYPLNVPLIADAGWGKNWLEAH